MKSSKIEKELNPHFFTTLEQYVKHQTLEIELTLKNGQRVVIDKNRTIEGNEVVQVLEAGNDLRIAIQDIKKADIYAV